MKTINIEIFNRFQQVKKIRLGNGIYNVNTFTSEEKIDYVGLYKTGRKNYNTLIRKDELFLRWSVKNGILHYQQRVNAGLTGYESVNYIPAEV